MRNRIHRRYILLLFLPLAAILIVCMWMSLYSHNSGIKNMQQHVEENTLRATESLSENIDSMIRHTKLSAMNMAGHAAGTSTVGTALFTQYITSIDNSLITSLNTECLLNPAIDRAYVFLFDQNRVINQTSALNQADTHFSDYLKINGLEYDSFVRLYTSRYYQGEIFPDVSLSYLGNDYTSWMMVQSVPLNPTKTPTGLIVLMLDETSVTKRLKENLADQDSVCLLLGSNGKFLSSQGENRLWEEKNLELLLSEASSNKSTLFSMRNTDGKEFLVTVASSVAGRIICAQPVDTAFSGIHRYNITLLLLMMSMILLAVLIAVYFTGRNARAMLRVLNTILPQHRSESARNVFSYMQEAISNAQEHEALLSAHANQQTMILKSLFIKRLMRGEWQTESDLLKDEAEAGLNIESAYYHVLMIHFREKVLSPSVFHCFNEILKAEFGENAYLTQMDEENLACLLLCDESDVSESIEALAEEFSKNYPVVTLVGTTALDLMGISRSYRQVRMMSRMVQDSLSPLKWYSELFQDEALYNFEYSVYAETGLRNNIISGNKDGVASILTDLYEKNLPNGIQSDHILRFFACDLYRLVHHLGTSVETMEKKEQLSRIHLLLDRVMENPRSFDNLFESVKAYCLLLCEESKAKRPNSNDETLERITAYVDEHFRDPELTVASIADALGLTVKYLSMFFREQTNGKISVYIENKRIAHACMLLETTDMTINDVSVASGYALTHTFRGAYKKVQGVTPLEWKKSRQEA